MTKKPAVRKPATMIRGISPELWRKAKAKAALEGLPMRVVILRLLEGYVR